MLNNSLSYYMDVANVCTFCKREKETYIHLFWDCSLIQELWKFVHSLVPQQGRTKEVSLFPSNVSYKVLLLLTLCKYHIFLCRVAHQIPTVKHFKNKAAFHTRALKASFLSDSATFYKRWGSLEQDFVSQ